MASANQPLDRWGEMLEKILECGSSLELWGCDYLCGGQPRSPPFYADT